MKKFLITYVLLSITCIGFCQDYFGDVNYVKQECFSKLANIWKKDTLYSILSDSGSSFFPNYSVGDTLGVAYSSGYDKSLLKATISDNYFTVIREGIDSVNISYYFNKDSLFMDWSHIWKSCRVKYYNIDSISKNLNQVLQNKTNKWVKVKDDYYITKKKFSFLGTGGEPTYYLVGQMKIVKPDDEEVKLELLLTPLIIERKKWKFLVKGK